MLKCSKYARLGLYSKDEIIQYTKDPSVTIIQIDHIGDGYFLAEIRTSTSYLKTLNELRCEDGLPPVIDDL